MISRVLRDWVWLQRSQWLPRDQLAVLQDRKLREMISHAFQKVPFYQGLYKAVGVDIGDIKGVKDIIKLPLIDRRLIARTSLTERTATDADLTSCIPITTSGSTETPLTVLEDLFSACYRAALYIRFSWAYGVRPWHKVCLAGPGSDRRNVYNSTEGFSGRVLRRRIRTISLEADIPEAIKFLIKWKPHALIARRSEFRRLIECCEERGRSPVLNLAVGSHELFDSSTRGHIGNSLHADVFDMYGLTEVGTTAWECPSRAGYHLNADSLVVEFLREGEPVSPGEPGELCITNLYKSATPIIRYLTQDVATLINDECSCGRGLPLLKNIQPRIIQRS